jgi:hypothetical protein
MPRFAGCVTFWRSISKNCDNSRLSSDRRFGISTHLFHEQRLTREHLVHIAAHGFEAVERVRDERAHFDYHDAAAIAQLANGCPIRVSSSTRVHAPIFDAMKNGQWSARTRTRPVTKRDGRPALAETEAALRDRGAGPVRLLVLHLGMPTASRFRHATISRTPPGEASKTSLAMASNVNVRLRSK